MESTLLKLLTDQSGTVIVSAIAFVFFWKITVNFTETIKQYSKQVTEVSKDTNETSRNLAMRLQEFSDTNRQQVETIKELKEIIQRLYNKLYDRTKKETKKD